MQEISQGIVETFRIQLPTVVLVPEREYTLGNIVYLEWVGRRREGGGGGGGGGGEREETYYYLP